MLKKDERFVSVQLALGEICAEYDRLRVENNALTKKIEEVEAKNIRLEERVEKFVIAFNELPGDEDTKQKYIGLISTLLLSPLAVLLKTNQYKKISAGVSAILDFFYGEKEFANEISLVLKAVAESESQDEFVGIADNILQKAEAKADTQESKKLAAFVEKINTNCDFSAVD